MYQTVQMAKNPKSAVDKMLKSNPQVQQVMEYVNQNGGDPKAAFYKLAEEKGVNPNEIINQLK